MSRESRAARGWSRRLLVDLSALGGSRPRAERSAGPAWRRAATASRFSAARRSASAPCSARRGFRRRARRQMTLTPPSARTTATMTATAPSAFQRGCSAAAGSVRRWKSHCRSLVLPRSYPEASVTLAGRVSPVDDPRTAISPSPPTVLAVAREHEARNVDRTLQIEIARSRSCTRPSNLLATDATTTSTGREPLSRPTWGCCPATHSPS